MKFLAWLFFICSVAASAQMEFLTVPEGFVVERVAEPLGGQCSEALMTADDCMSRIPLALTFPAGTF